LLPQEEFFMELKNKCCGGKEMATAMAVRMTDRF
jgi:hypothetical protein